MVCTSWYVIFVVLCNHLLLYLHIYQVPPYICHADHLTWSPPLFKVLVFLFPKQNYDYQGMRCLLPYFIASRALLLSSYTILMKFCILVSKKHFLRVQYLNYFIKCNVGKKGHTNYWNRYVKNSHEYVLQKERLYQDAYGMFKNCGSLDNREGLRHEFHNAHNEYILQIRASNRLIDDFQITIPQVLKVSCWTYPQNSVVDCQTFVLNIVCVLGRSYNFHFWKKKKFTRACHPVSKSMSQENQGVI